MRAVQTPGVVAEQTRVAEETLREVEDLLRSIVDADLHRADPGGGWTGAQIVTHMTLAGLLWVADVQRLVADPDLDLFYREEIGHDATGAVPPTAAEAADKIVGHLAHHRDQLHDVLRSRGRLPQRFDQSAAGPGAEG
jgi:DinB superfamily